MYATASLADDISGSETISSKGVPALLRSIPVPAMPSCIDFPASSSRCALVKLIIFFAPSISISTFPPETIGSSIWVI